MEYLFMFIAMVITGFWANSVGPGDYTPTIGGCVIVGLFFERKLRMKYRCNKCKKDWALKKVATNLDSTENIAVLKEVKNRNRNGEVIGTSEQYVPGTRYIYVDTYKCKYCRETTIHYRSKDSV